MKGRPERMGNDEGEEVEKNDEQANMVPLNSVYKGSSHKVVPMLN